MVTKNGRIIKEGGYLLNGWKKRGVWNYLGFEGPKRRLLIRKGRSLLRKEGFPTLLLPNKGDIMEN